ncbi:M20 metallopeptidase family protein [Propionicicella superfundia]|uniref:M20 metallopeptidase family protein n=1 Tax=Propionicicella superfundia TaxID=348582 RepID=UPI00040E4D98|nr:M20 family metallopeptidase [Propionicicella superfundia]
MTFQSAAHLLAALSSAIDVHLPAAIALRRELHRIPELGGAEDETPLRLQAELSGLATETIAGTGFAARLGDGGPAIALRTELDGLPITEETGVAWASHNGAMHACGHDIHMSAMVAVLRAAQTLPLPAAVLGVFQPREEVNPPGAPDVVAEGVLTRHDVRAIVAAHVQPQVAKGVVSAEFGVVNAAADEFEVVVHGRGGHGAYPQATIDPIPTLASIVLGLQELVSRKIDPMHPTVVTVGAIRAGSAANVIPSRASLRGTVRTTDEADRATLHAEIRNVATHAAQSRGATAEVRIVEGEPVLRNDPALVRATRTALSELVPLATTPFRSCGSDDFAHFCDRVPSLMMFVGTGREPDGPVLHHARFLPPDETIAVTARALAAGFVGGLVSQGLLPA